MSEALTEAQARIRASVEAKDKAALSAELKMLEGMRAFVEGNYPMVKDAVSRIRESEEQAAQEATLAAAAAVVPVVSVP